MPISDYMQNLRAKVGRDLLMMPGANDDESLDVRHSDYGQGEDPKRIACHLKSKWVEWEREK